MNCLETVHEEVMTDETVSEQRQVPSTSTGLKFEVRTVFSYCCNLIACVVFVILTVSAIPNFVLLVQFQNGR